MRNCERHLCRVTKMVTPTKLPRGRSTCSGDCLTRMGSGWQTHSLLLLALKLGSLFVLLDHLGAAVVLHKRLHISNHTSLRRGNLTSFWTKTVRPIISQPTAIIPAAPRIFVKAVVVTLAATLTPCCRCLGSVRRRRQVSKNLHSRRSRRERVPRSGSKNLRVPMVIGFHAHASRVLAKLGGDCDINDDTLTTLSLGTTAPNLLKNHFGEVLRLLGFY